MAPTLTLGDRTLVLSPRLAWRAVRADFASQPRPLKIWFGFLLVLLAIGAVGAAFSLNPGDEVYGTRPSFEWGILITAYVFFAITTSGLCLASSLGTVFGIDRFRPLEKRHALLALLSLITAFGVIALDLHYPIRLGFGAVLSPSPLSPMWWMGVLYGGYLFLLMIEVWSMFRGHERIHNVSCLLASFMAILAPSTLGAVFGVLASKPFWHGSFTPPSLLMAALLAGIALLGIVFACVVRFRLAGWERAESLAIPGLRVLLTIALFTALLVVGWQVLTSLYGAVPGLSDAMWAMVLGPLAPTFWIGKVLMGLVIPLLLVVVPRFYAVRGLFLASVLTFAGVFLDRVLFVNAGQIVSSTTSAGVATFPYNEYTPSPVEIAVVIGAFGFLAFAYTLCERYLDMSEHTGDHLPILSRWGRHEPHPDDEAHRPYHPAHKAPQAHGPAPAEQ
jgi:molybdopterin-containing oxidoreductase family membrane subunit